MEPALPGHWCCPLQGGKRPHDVGKPGGVEAFVNHPNDLTAACQGAFGKRAHQAGFPTAVHQLPPAQANPCADGACRSFIGSSFAGA